VEIRCRFYIVNGWNAKLNEAWKTPKVKEKEEEGAIMGPGNITKSRSLIKITL